MVELFESERASIADVASEAEPELQLIRDELASRDVLTQLCVQMCKDGPTMDSDGNLVVDSVRPALQTLAPVWLSHG